MNDRPRAARLRLRSAVASGDAVAVSTVVLFELWYGIARSQRPVESSDDLRAFLTGAVDVAPFDQGDAELAGRLRAELADRGAPIGPYDLLIAAQALRSGATLVTANRSEFRRIRGLAIEDWTA